MKVLGGRGEKTQGGGVGGAGGGAVVAARRCGGVGAEATHTGGRGGRSETDLEGTSEFSQDVHVLVWFWFARRRPLTLDGPAGEILLVQWAWPSLP